MSTGEKFVPRRRRIPLAALGVTLLTLAAWAHQPAAPSMKTEHFDADPLWESHQNRVTSPRVVLTRQDFGYSRTNHAGRAAGEVGGCISPSSKPAFYADKIPVKTLHDRLRASGRFAITSTQPAGGMFFGWFSASQPEGTGRPLNSLGMYFDCETSGARLSVWLIGATNKSCGTFVTAVEPGRNRPTQIKPDGTRFQWTLDYHPQASHGNGQIEFQIKSIGNDSEVFDRQVSVDLPPGFKDEGANFDHFGMMNVLKPGGHLHIYFDDVEYAGRSSGFENDPQWDSSGNRAEFKDAMRAGNHSFGFSPHTRFAGGSKGELGGNFWRGGDFAYYADPVGPFTMTDRLEARGKVMLLVGAHDSDMYLGFFLSDSRTKPPANGKNFLGIHVGGPTRVGHYFLPEFANAEEICVRAEKGPVLVPGKVFEWSLVYDPLALEGRGAIHATLGNESVTLPIRGDREEAGPRFDRFGVFTSSADGQLIRIFFDDLSYSSRR